MTDVMISVVDGVGVGAVTVEGAGLFEDGGGLLDCGREEAGGLLDEAGNDTEDGVEGGWLVGGGVVTVLLLMATR